jgi:hypothetical protein
MILDLLSSLAVTLIHAISAVFNWHDSIELTVIPSTPEEQNPSLMFIYSIFR